MERKATEVIAYFRKRYYQFNGATDILWLVFDECSIVKRKKNGLQPSGPLYKAANESSCLNICLITDK
ncbi:MAG TPA: hypothetical protein PLS50_06370 [Candidatus Dojkabacteria bacterium]|nr:hypothetical protein [Candidatus Dojkabacteria bacterium]